MRTGSMTITDTSSIDIVAARPESRVVITPEPEVRITLAVQWPPTPEAETLLERVRETLAAAGWTFEVEMLRSSP